MKRKKYAFGTKVNDYIENPGTALTEDQIAHAKAQSEAFNNPWTQGLNIAGQVGMQVGSSMGGMSTAGDAVGGKLGNFLTKNGQFLDDAMVMGSGAAQPFAMGGQVPVEVEGNEVGETPDGQLLDFQGPSHEEGGIPVDLPGGTDIYSDRISVDGKTMAQRKKARELKLAKLEKQFKKSPTDAILKNSILRVKETNAIQESKDMQMQKAMSGQNDKMAMGGVVDPNESPYEVDENGNPKINSGDTWKGDNPNAGFAMPRWMTEMNTHLRRSDLDVGYKNGEETGILEGGYLNTSTTKKEYVNGEKVDVTTKDVFDPKIKYGTKTTMKGKNNTSVTWNGAATDSNTAQTKKLDKANWGGAHGFRGKNWKQDALSEFKKDPNLTDEENLKKFKEANPFFEKGRKRHQNYQLQGQNPTVDRWYTNAEENALDELATAGKNATPKMADGGTVEDPLKALAEQMKASGVTNVGEATPEMLQMMWDGISQKFEPSGEMSIPGAGNTKADNSFVEVSGKSEPAFNEEALTTKISPEVPTEFTPEIEAPEAMAKLPEVDFGNGFNPNPNQPKPTTENRLDNVSIPTNPDNTLADANRAYTPEDIGAKKVAEKEAMSNQELFGMPNAVEALGIAGQVYSSMKPLQNTLNNRAGDTANINPYLNFGEDALESIDQQKQFVDQQEARKLQDLELARNSALKRGRNSARSANTQRALDLASEQSVNNSKSGVYNDSAKQMTGILGSQAQAESQRDRMQMMGEFQRDQADRRDRDNFYSQLSTNQVGLGRGTQEVSKTLSEIANNHRKLNSVNSKHPNYKMDKQGNITDKQGKKLSGPELKKATEEMAELGKEEQPSEEAIMKYLQANPELAQSFLNNKG